MPQPLFLGAQSEANSLQFLAGPQWSEPVGPQQELAPLHSLKWLFLPPLGSPPK